MVFDLATFLEEQLAFSTRTFGPGPRTASTLGHIRKELAEVEAAPQDVLEWVDIMICAFDGALREGHTPEAIVQGLQNKQAINKKRRWPDWRKLPLDAVIEHIREDEVSSSLNPDDETD